MSNELREKIASLQHEQWSGWMEYLFSKCIESPFTTIPDWAVERWKRQMSTPYAELPEEEKELDRIEADKYLPIITAEKLALLERIEKANGKPLELRTLTPWAAVSQEIAAIRNELEGKEGLNTPSHIVFKPVL